MFAKISLLHRLEWRSSPVLCVRQNMAGMFLTSLVLVDGWWAWSDWYQTATFHSQLSLSNILKTLTSEHLCSFSETPKIGRKREDWVFILDRLRLGSVHLHLGDDPKAFFLSFIKGPLMFNGGSLKAGDFLSPLFSVAGHRDVRRYE